jgi:hypothetical protein
MSENREDDAREGQERIGELPASDSELAGGERKGTGDSDIWIPLPAGAPPSPSGVRAPSEPLDPEEPEEARRSVPPPEDPEESVSTRSGSPTPPDPSE